MIHVLKSRVVQDDLAIKTFRVWKASSHFFLKAKDISIDAWVVHCFSVGNQAFAEARVRKLRVFNHDFGSIISA